MTSEFKPGQAVRVEGVVEWAGELRPGSCGVVVMDLSTPIARRTVVVDASAVHLAPGDGERGYRALTLLRELVIGEEFAGDEYPERFRKFVSEICDLARPLIVEEENTNGDNE